MHRPALPTVERIISDARRLVVLEGIVDHTNVGAAFRSAAALGFDGILIDPSCADPLYRRSVRVSMGAVLTFPWTRAPLWPQELHRLHSAGFTSFSLTPDEEAGSLVDAAAAYGSGKVALVMGAEGDGLSAQVLVDTDQRIRIPMEAGIDSLNIAAAAAVACYAFTFAPESPEIERGCWDSGGIVSKWQACLTHQKHPLTPGCSLTDMVWWCDSRPTRVVVQRSWTHCTATSTGSTRSRRQSSLSSLSIPMMSKWCGSMSGFTRRPGWTPIAPPPRSANS